MAWEFSEFNLDQLGFLGRGKSKHRPRNDPSLYGGKYPFVQTGDVKAANLYLNSFEQTYSDKGLSQSKLWDKETLVITIAANIAETAVLKIDACFPDSVVGFIPNEELVDVYYIKYYIDYIKREIQSISQGTTQDNLSLDKLRTFKLKVPKERDVVSRISSTLLNYDNLIENNNRRIAILEDMAQSLYREWFVNFRYPDHSDVLDDSSPDALIESKGKPKLIDSPLGQIPEGWEVKRLDEVADVNPQSITKKNAPESIGYIDIKSVGSGIVNEVKTMQFKDAPSRAKRIVVDGDIIWATVRPNRKQFSYICKPSTNTIASTGFAVLRSKMVPASYMYSFTTTDSFASYLVNHATGSAYPAVNSDIFKKANILVPASELLDKFDELCLATMQQSEVLKKKNKNLKQQRDMLLPKLISGQIELKD